MMKATKTKVKPTLQMQGGDFKTAATQRGQHNKIQKACWTKGQMWLGGRFSQTANRV